MGDTNKKYPTISKIFLYFFLLYSLLLPSKTVADENTKILDILPRLSAAYSQISEINWLSTVLDSGLVLPTNITAQCKSDLDYFFESFLSSKHGGPFATWTLRGIDAFGKLPSGILEGDFNSLGRFYECIELEVFKKDDNETPDFTGKYCVAFILIVDEEGKSMFPAHPKLGICMPSTCHPEDITKIINYFTSTTPVRFAVMEKYCQVKDSKPWEMKTIFAISIFFLLICLVVVGTLKDIGNNWHKKMIPNEKLKYKLQKNNALFGKIEPLVLAFSARTNVAKIFTVNDDANEMSCVHGYRFLATVWVITVHVFVMVVQDYPWKNAARSLLTVTNNIFTLAITQAVLCSDSFFVMAGLLVTYHTFKQMDKFGGKLNLKVFYLHRYFRLTPAYAANLLFIVGLYKYIGEGPLWPFIYDSSDKCSHHWWKNLLYIQNLWGSFYDQCFLPSWYLAVDFQMYLAAPLFLIPLYRKPKLGLLLMGTAFVITIIVPGILIYIYDMESFTGRQCRAENMDLWTNTIYNKPWNRMSTYFIGIYLGYELYSKGLDIKVPQKLVWIGWISCIVTMCSIVFGPFEYFKGKLMTPMMYALYGAFARPLWGLSMAWILFACVTGNGGVVNTFLSWKAFVPVSRLSYCMYLVHIILVHSIYYLQFDGMYFSWVMLLIMVTAITVLATFVALILSLLTEAPMMQIEKIVLAKYLPQKENEKSKSLLVDTKGLEKSENEMILFAQKENDPNGYTINVMGSNARRRF